MSNDGKSLNVPAYKVTEARPLPLNLEHDAPFFNRLASYPTPRLVYPVRKIVFTIKSKGKEWGRSREREAGASSWTWFEVGLERFDATQTCGFS